MFANVKTVFKREFKSYFDSPVAYVFLVAFLVLVGFMTFGIYIKKCISPVRICLQTRNARNAEFLVIC